MPEEQTKSGWTKMPPELILEIASYISESEDPSLCNFARVCKHSLDCIQPLIYREYVRKGPEDSLVPFLRTLCQRPDLAKKVTTIRFRGGNDDTAADDSSQSYCDYQLFLTSAVQAGIIHEDEATSPDGLYVTSLRRSTERSHILLMLALVPHLQTLELTSLPPNFTMMWDYYLGRSETALRNLAHVTMVGREKLLLPRPDLPIWHLMLCPKLTSVSLSNIASPRSKSPGYDRFCDAGGAFATKKLSKLTIHQCVIAFPVIEMLVSGQPLCEVHLVALNVRPDPYPSCRFDAPAVARALSSASSTLTALTLFATESFWWDNFTFGAFQNLQRMEAKFKHLVPCYGQPNSTSFTATMNSTVSALPRCLPESLRELRLILDDPVYFDGHWLSALCISKEEGRFPNLEAVDVSLGLTPGNDEDGFDPAAAWRANPPQSKEFEKVGVRFSVR